MSRGRPPKSQIRQNVIDILFFLKKGYGYEIHDIYNNIFPKVTMRSVYYHLKQGVKLEEFRVDRVEKTKGDYSWGPEAEKIFYALGKNANPRINERIREYVDNRKLNK